MLSMMSELSRIVVRFSPPKCPAAQTYSIGVFDKAPGASKPESVLITHEDITQSKALIVCLGNVRYSKKSFSPRARS
jgi:hypothetical protein